MAKICATLADAVTLINSLYDIDSEAPSSGDEDYTVWTSLLNVAINLWDNEEGMLWKELFTKLDDAADGDKTAAAGDFSYDLPTNFAFSNAANVWIGSNTNKTPYKVIKIQDVQLYENDSENWCYFATDTLEFNPNCAVKAGTIRYDYYKYATALTGPTSAFEMSDPMFAVYYVLSELKKEEGDTTAAAIATQKLEAMRTKNEMSTWNQDSSLLGNTDTGFGR